MLLSVLCGALVCSCGQLGPHQSAAPSPPPLVCPLPACSPGTIRWQVSLPGGYEFLERTTVAPSDAKERITGTGITGTVAGDVLVETGGADLVGIDLGTGRELWRRPLPAPPANGALQPPAAQQGVVVVGDEILSARDGHLLSQLPAMTASVRSASGPVSVAVPSPAVLGFAGGAVIRSGAGVISADDVTSGRQRWTAQLTPGAGHAIDAGILYMDDDTFVPHSTGSATAIQRLDLGSGRRLPSLKLPAPVLGAGVLAAADGVVLVGAEAIDEASGAVRWTATVDAIDRAHRRFCALRASPPVCYDARSGKPFTSGLPQASGSFVAPAGSIVGLVGRPMQYALGRPQSHLVTVPDVTRVTLTAYDFVAGASLWQSPDFGLLTALIASGVSSPAPPVFIGVACAGMDGARWTGWPGWPVEHRCADTRLVAVDW